jgi:hypothetical protein
LEFLQLADRAVKENKMSKLRLIVPSGRNLWELCADALQPECSYEENPGVFDMHGDPASLGESTLFQRDSDQFPAESVLQNIGEKLRAFPRWLRSRESAFGFRVACATMTVAIVAFLQDTQEFFIRQRLIWAIIVINLSMSPTVGQSLSNFVLRVVGTAAAVALTILIWYIGGQTAAGTITVLFFFFCGDFYIQIEFPQYRLIALVCILTTTLILGYELQVHRIGEEIAISNGQPYYPIYILAPYRLATISAGIFVAFFWTIFPYPITEHSLLPQGLGTLLYLLATYHSLIQEMLCRRFHSHDSRHDSSTSLSQKLAKAQKGVHSNQLLVLKDLRTISDFISWELPIGGTFSIQNWERIMFCVEEYDES